MSQNQSNGRAFALFGLCLLVIVLALFRQSFVPAMVVFSNDGPLGGLSQKAVEAPSAFTGVWFDLNSIGVAGGAFPFSLTQTLAWLLGPLYFAKFFVPIAVLFVGMCAWVCFRAMELSTPACFLGALAAALNSDFFSTACWGVGAQTIAFGFCFLALAAVTGTPPRYSWLGVALAGLAVGMNVTEAADIGAIFSVFVAAFVVYHAWVTPTGQVGRVTPCAPRTHPGESGAHGVTHPTFGFAAKRIGLGLARLAVVAGFAAFIAAQALNVLVGTAIKGIAGAEQTKEAREARWDWATQWSMPKREALSLVVPGLFGYRMDTPDGGNYWGGAGRDAAWYRWWEGGQQGPPPNPNQQYIRHAGGGVYAGVLVVLVAIWAGLQSFRTEASVFSAVNRKLIWFWLGVLLVSLLLGFGRHAPFYQFLYALPYSSTFRNPAKFFHVLSWGLVILFAYGVHGLSRRYLESATTGATSLPERWRNWWAKVRGFDRKWCVGCMLAVGLSLLAWLMYASARNGLESYLQTVQFDEDMAKVIAGFSIRQVGWFWLFVLLSCGAVALVFTGWFAGARARWAGIMLGVLLVADLGRANLPWIIHWDYKLKYASNPVIDFLRERPFEHRVAIAPEIYQRIFMLPQDLLRADTVFRYLYEIEWKQHHFLYYDVQSLDVVQMPRMPADLAAFEGMFQIRFTQDSDGRWLIVPETLSLQTRRWQLTNARYLLGPVGYVDFLNQKFDPAQKRFRAVERFRVEPKPGFAPSPRPVEWTAVPDTNAPYAVIEFTGALPRAKLYANWQVSTNDTATLARLADAEFDPAQTVLVADAADLPAITAGPNRDAGTIEFTSYTPKRITLRAKAETPVMLLLNDRFDPDWKVSVNGQPAPLLRANFIMRGVHLTPGENRVEFKYQPRVTAFYTSLAAIGVGIILLGCLMNVSRREQPR